MNEDSMESFVIIKKISQTENYELVVGIVPGDKVPQYLIFNLDHDVLEFAHNVLSYALEAMDDLQRRLDAYYTEDEEVKEEKLEQKHKVIN